MDDQTKERGAWEEYLGPRSPLTARERQFLRGLLRGLSPADAAALHGRRPRYQGWDDEAVRLLGHEHVAAAIKRLAPLLQDAALSARLLAPYAREALARNLDGSAQARLGAARDLIALAGEEGAADPLAKWQERQAQRKSAKPQQDLQADKIHYGNSLSPSPPKPAKA